jgi:hypothetical protein
MRRKILIGGMAVCLAGAMALPAMAQPGSVYYAPAPYYYPPAPWAFRAAPSNYQGPDGTYDSLADFTRDLRGIPCGVECSYRAQQRWGMVPPNRYVPH